MDGYAPIDAYLGLEGWCLEVECGRLVSTARRLKLRFSRHCPGFEAFVRVFSRLSAAA